MLSCLLLCLAAGLQEPAPPPAGWLPRRELGAAAFVEAHPGWDGRGVRVAILDTGIDPGHPWLQRTSTGARKIADWYDATGDGRLALPARATAGPDATLIGLSGRRLRLGRWAAHGREFHLGRLDLDFLPGSLRRRVLAERRRDFEEARRRAAEEALLAAPAAAPDPVAAERRRATAEFSDPGPVWDLLLFSGEDGVWRLLVDRDADGDLEEEPALRPFRLSGDWITLGAGAELHLAWGAPAEDGGALTLFYDADGHGTHVAGIVGAWAGPEAPFTGLAPGVELVAIKIGNGKFGGATTGFSIAKAMDYALAAGCDVVNISFGGPSFAADGREPDARILDEAARRGLVVVTSAGNEGPCLTTVGAPATSRTAIAVAAAVWPETERIAYGALDPVGPLLFDFSSRGPLPGGGQGITCTAPGAAVSSLPSWLLTPAENFNGTSMAAPQVTGLMALLRSAAADAGVPAGPARLRRALRLACRPLPGVAGIEQGAGVPDAGRAWQALQDLATAGDAGERRLEAVVVNPFGEGGGIYERDPAGRTPFERQVRVRPVFREDEPDAARAAYLHIFRLESDVPWVQVPEALYLTAGGRSFPVRVDPTKLGPGLHAGRVLLQDTAEPPGLGPALVVPVTLVLPEETRAASGHGLRRRMELRPGELRRLFVRVPFGARRARLRMRQDGAGRNEYRVGLGSVSGFRYWGDRQSRGRFVLGDGEEAEQAVPVEAGTVLEVAVAARWAVNRPAALDLDLEFLGLEPQHEEWEIPAGQGCGYLGLKSPLRAEEVRLSAVVDRLILPVTAAWKLVPDPVRPVILDGRRMFQSVVEWPVEVDASVRALELVMPRSIQTTEIREDLVVEAEDAEGRAVVREVVQEAVTPLGSLPPGRYTFRLRHASLGAGPLEARYAGAELHLLREPRALTLAGDLEALYRGEGGGEQVHIPYLGVRQVFARVDLPALPPGARHGGRLRAERPDGTLLLELPIRVVRPGGEVLPVQAPAAGGAAEAGAFRSAADREGVTPAELLVLARAWKDAALESWEAELAWLQALARAGLADLARERAAGFLGRFPRRVEPFLAAAPVWNTPAGE